MDWNSYNMTVVLPNGINLLLTYKPDCEETHASSVFSGTGCVGAVFDLNSDKGPNKIGEDIITYGNVLISGVMIFNGKKWKLPFYTQGVSYQECLELKNKVW